MTVIHKEGSFRKDQAYENKTDLKGVEELASVAAALHMNGGDISHITGKVPLCDLKIFKKYMEDYLRLFKEP